MKPFNSRPRETGLQAFIIIDDKERLMLRLERRSREIKKEKRQREEGQLGKTSTLTLTPETSTTVQGNIASVLQDTRNQFMVGVFFASAMIVGSAIYMDKTKPQEYQSNAVQPVHPITDLKVQSRFDTTRGQTQNIDQQIHKATNQDYESQREEKSSSIIVTAKE